MTAAVYCSHAELDRRHRPNASHPTACEGQMIVESHDPPVWVLVCDVCGFECGIPARRADPSIGRRLRLGQAGFPAMFAERRFEEDAHNRELLFRLRGWVRDFTAWHQTPGDRRPLFEELRAPALHGRPGRGKTHLLVALSRLLIQDAGVAVMFRSVAGLLDDLQQSFGDDAEHQRIWERATSVDVLALDDVGAEDATSWRVDRLSRLVDERYQHDRPLLVATNYPPGLWEERLDARTLSRLRAMVFPVELRGPDRRQTSLGVDMRQQDKELARG